MANGRCQMHGGKSLAGVASPTFKHGRYSQSLAASLPTPLRERFEAAMSDPELLSLRKYVALFDVRCAEAAEKLAAFDPGSYRTTLLSLWEEFARANTQRIDQDDPRGEERRAAKAARITELLTDIGKTIRDGADEESVWQEVFAAVKDRMAATRDEQRRLNDLHPNLTVEQAFALAARLADSVRRVVQDRDVLSRISVARQAVSSLHAEFIVDDDALFLRDLQSTNGTYVNGDRMKGQVEVHPDDLIQFADMPFRLGRQSSDMESRTMQEDVCDRALGLVQFDKLIHDRAMLSHFQPIVDLRNNQTVAYEILSRSRLVGLEHPLAMFEVATQLNREIELSRAMRMVGIRTCALFPEPPHVFINTHPLELADDGLLDSITGLRRLTASQPITIEIHEAAVGDVSLMKELRARLHDLDMRLAFDDFGAGVNGAPIVQRLAVE